MTGARPGARASDPGARPDARPGGRAAASPGGRWRTLTRSGCALLVGGAALLGTAPLAAADDTAAAQYPSVDPQASAASPAVPASGDGWLDWGIKESFRNYVEGPVAEGTIEVTPPATRNADGTFRYGDGSGALGDSEGTLTTAFGGDVYFEGHGEGESASLRLWVMDPRVVIDGSSGTLHADLRSLGESGLVDYPDLALATLDLAGHSVVPDEDGLVSVTGVDATLTADGAPAFGGFYEAGEPLDAVAFSVWVEAGPSPTPTPTDTSSASPTPSPSDTSSETSEPSDTATLPPAPSGSPSASWAPGEISSGLLDWGVKASFLSYISGGIANGGWTTTSGVAEINGAFRWTLAYGNYDLPDATGTASFAGGVNFTGHDDALDITLSRPQVRFSGADTAVLLLDVRSKSLDDAEVTEQRAVEFATLDLSAAAAEIGDTTVRYGGIPAALTAAGATGFGGFYEAGTALDPIGISFAVGGDTVPGGGSANPDGLAHTGVQLELALVGAVLLLLGALLVSASRVAAGRPGGEHA